MITVDFILGIVLGAIYGISLSVYVVYREVKKKRRKEV